MHLGIPAHVLVHVQKSSIIQLLYHKWSRFSQVDLVSSVEALTAHKIWLDSSSALSIAYHAQNDTGRLANKYASSSSEKTAADLQYAMGMST